MLIHRRIAPVDQLPPFEPRDRREARRRRKGWMLRL